MTNGIHIQFGKAGNAYRLAMSVSPLLPREIPVVVEVFTGFWTKPEEVDRVEIGDACALVLTADHEIRAGEHPGDVAKKLSYVLWQRLERYVKVTVETTYLGETPDTHFEFGETQYSQAFGTRFENE